MMVFVQKKSKIFLEHNSPALNSSYHRAIQKDSLPGVKLK